MRRALLLLTVLLTAAPAFAETPEYDERVYLTQPQALDVALPAHDHVAPRQFTPSAEARKALQRKLGRKLEDERFTFFEGTAAGKPVGYAIVLDEQGKHFPMTFVVGLTPEGVVREVAVMVYREKRGDAVRRRRFLDQFDGKTEADPIMINRDIVHLTGATVSSWSIAAGVKKAVVLFDALVKPGVTQ
jgi:Na+-translocating ferredoxin:NAD+ oxidoreductase RnfG subunit